MAELYLISPPDFDLDEFEKKLRNILTKFKLPVFQLRLKDKTESEVEKYATKLLETCREFNCAFILNDYVDIALKIGANGVHVGSHDQDIAKIRQKSGENFMIGASCYNSRDLALQASLDGANYLSFGAFFPTKTKKVKAKADISIIKWANEIFDLPISAIGGITADNCSDLVKAKADFICVISYVWGHPKGEEFAVKEILKTL